MSFGGVAAVGTVASASQIQAVSPAHIAGSVQVIVQQNGQSSTPVNFTYNAVTPTVSSISPNSGPTAGGTQVTITGSNFLAGALVLFGTASASSATVVSSTQIQAVAPANAAGPVNVTVENPGNVSSSNSGAYTYVSSSSGPPTITSVSPTSGPAGTQITVTGTNFETGVTVSVGGTSASSTFVSSTELQASIPSMATGTYSVTVTDPDPTSATLNSAFTVTAASSSESLLTGCTVNETNNSPSCATPSGWTLLTAEGFGGGKVNGSGTLAYYNPVGNSPQVSSASGIGHTGSYGLGCYVTGDNSYCGYTVSPGAVNEIYVSYWEYLSSNAIIVEDFYVGEMKDSSQDLRFDPNPPGGQAYQSTGWVPEWYSEGSNGSVACYPAPYGCTTGGHGTVTTGAASVSGSMPAGGWHQWELDIKPSTCTGSTMNTDGFMAVYLNGQLVSEVTNAGITGCPSLAGNSTITMEAGGFVSVAVEENSSNQCVTAGSSTATHNLYCDPIFTSCPALQANGTTVCMGNQQQYTRNIDDIIILKK